MNPENALPLGRQQGLVSEQMRQRARLCRPVCEPPGDQVAVESLIMCLNTAFRALAAASKSTPSFELWERNVVNRCVDQHPV